MIVCYKGLKKNVNVSKPSNHLSKGLGGTIIGCMVKHMLYGTTYSKSMNQPGEVANSARGQLNKENEYFPVRVRA